MSDTKWMKKTKRKILIKRAKHKSRNTKLNNSNEDCALRIQQQQEIYDRDRLHKNMFDVPTFKLCMFNEYYSHRVDL